VETSAVIGLRRHSTTYTTGP